jgi:hypothetical protein
MNVKFFVVILKFLFFFHFAKNIFVVFFLHASRKMIVDEKLNY